MFEVLVESGPRSAPALGSRLASLSLHGTLIVIAAVGVQHGVTAPAPKLVAVPIEIFSDPNGESNPGPARPSGRAPVLAPADLPEIPTTVPTMIPPATTTGPTPSSGPTAREIAGRALGEREVGWDGDRASSVLLAGEVDDPVAVLLAVLPVYPRALAVAGVPGEVRVEFVVDSAGACEPASVRIVSSSDPAFEAPARRAVCQSKYRPGRVRGRAVRQLVHQRIAFRMAQ